MVLKIQKEPVNLDLSGMLAGASEVLMEDRRSKPDAKNNFAQARSKAYLRDMPELNREIGIKRNLSVMTAATVAA
jgi:hypothetical protein